MTRKLLGSRSLQSRAPRGSASSALPKVSNWKNEGAKATAERKAYFERLPELLSVPGAQLALDPDTIDKTWRSADVRVMYPGRHRLFRKKERNQFHSVFSRLVIGSIGVVGAALVMIAVVTLRWR